MKTASRDVANSPAITQQKGINNITLKYKEDLSPTFHFPEQMMSTPKAHSANDCLGMLGHMRIAPLSGNGEKRK